ncbi:MAG TPA: metal ABC transporter permease [Actinomycetota bacterium]
MAAARPSRPARGDQALGQVGLADLAGRSFGELFGGQQQRVLVARALVQDAVLLLLDEPFTGVEQGSVDRMLTLLERPAGEGRSMLVATHEVEQVRYPAVLIGPAATARLFARRVTPMMALACGVAVVCGVAGLYLSYYASVAGGASIVAVVLVVYLGARIARGSARTAARVSPPRETAPSR